MNDFIEGERVNWQESGGGPVHKGTVTDIWDTLIYVDLDEGGQEIVSCFVLEHLEEEE